jgi:hypothetical protein
MSERSVALPVAPEAALAALGEAAGIWNADLDRDSTGGRIRLPVIAGLRRGVLTARVTVEPLEPDGDGSRLLFREEGRKDALHIQAVIVLLVAVIGAALTVIWPFYPNLLPLAPFGALLALGGWFLVISRLRTSGPEEFLEAVQALATGQDEPPAASEGGE